MNKNICLVRTMGTVPDMDIENRILNNVVVATEQLASDGMIILAAGIDLSDFLLNPTVTAKHGWSNDGKSTSIAAALNIGVKNRELISAVQFADTMLGRDYAYLYGLNPKKEVYMRGWSIEGPIVTSEDWDFARAKQYLGKDWNETTAALIGRWATVIHVATKMLMKTFSAVEVGADRAALTRAYGDGVKTAGEIISRVDLDTAARQIKDLQDQLTTLKTQSEKEFLRLELASLIEQAQALGSDGAAAAARGDTAELLSELNALNEIMKQK